MRDILLALFMLSAFPMVLYRFHVGALVIAFISFMYPQSHAYGFASSLQWTDFFFVVTLGSYIVKSGFKTYEHHPLITMMLVFYAWVSLSTIFAINFDTSYQPWVKFSKILLIAILVYGLLGNERRLNALLKVMVLSFAFYGIKGGLFTIISGGSAHVLGPLKSFYADNNGMALVLVMTIPFMVFFFKNAESIYQRYFSMFCTIFTSIAVLGTQSRTGFAALVVSLLYFTWLQKKLFRAVTILVPIVCVAYFVMPQSWTDRMTTTTDYETDASFQGRVDMWQASTRIANDYPLLGGGFDVIYVNEVIAKYIPIGITARAIHSAYFQMIAEHGYVGLALFIFMLLYSYQTARKIARLSKGNDELVWFRDLTMAIRCSLVGYLVLAFTANIAFFDLLYFIIIITAITDNLLQKRVVPQRYSPYVRVPATI